MTTRCNPRVGCSGWIYRSWRGRFYPDGMPQRAWLRHYASVFDTVEVNNTFYRLPEASTFRGWRDQTPSGFLMAVKASRFLTHLKRLKSPARPLGRLFARAGHLGNRLGPVLYQLPPNMHLDLARLERFVRRVAFHNQRLGVRHVIEFRHPSWYTRETYALLERHAISMCLHDKRGAAIVEPLIGPCVYVRFHGTSGQYHGSYPASALERWAARLAEQWEEGKAIYAYFNNDPDATATRNALTLREAVLRRVSERSVDEA